MPQTENSSSPDLANQLKSALDSSDLSNDAKMAVVQSFYGESAPSDKNAFANSINDLPGVPGPFKAKLLTLKFPQLAPQGVATPPPGAPNPKPDNSQPWYDQNLIPVDKLVAGPQKGQPWYEQFGRGVAQGGAESGANLTSPKNLGIMGVMAGANMIPGVGELVDAGASLVLGEEQVREMIKSVPEIKKAYDANDWGKLGNLVGKDAASAFVSYKAGKRGVGKLKGQLKGKSGEGSRPDTTPAGGRRPPPPPPGASPTYPLIEAGTQKALGQPEGQTGPFNMPGQPGSPPQGQAGLPAGPQVQPLPAGQTPRQLPPASHIQLPGTPTAIPLPGDPQRLSGLAIEAGGPSGTPPPPGASLGRPDANPQAAEPGTGSTPVSRQLTDGSGPMTYEVYLEHAKTLPKEQLAQHIQQMLGAAMERAETLPKAKRAEFIKAAKSYIEPFEKILNEHEEVKGPEDPATPKKQAEPKLGTPKKDPVKKEPQPKAESNVGQETGPHDPEVASRVKNQIDSAKAKGIKNLKFTIDRGGNQKPLEIGVNTELDTPESLAAKIAKAGGGGKVQAESSDPDHPLKWSFYVGGGAAPPGAK